VIGIYLPVIESAYKECPHGQFGAQGLFQLLPGTAARYGVARDDMCNVEKITSAAAQYIADRMAELGEDSGSITLVLLSYSRGEEWVRDVLRQLRSTDNYERNFWALLANSETLDGSFSKADAGYVPSFFAAAIIGENPQSFGLKTPPLSTLAKDSRR
jgi:membrane-bound lytic murein transglycosylase D